MNTDFHSRAPFRYLTHESRHGASVQDRPTLGNLPRARRVQGWWLAPAIDLAAAFLALALVAIATGDRMLPAFFFRAPVVPGAQRRAGRLRQSRGIQPRR